jgi:oligosaccharyltransferase complex subunit alpha (ribophorin I)
VEHKIDLHHTYLDTLGRTTLTIKARNLPDEFRERELIISYKYSLLASLRKPFVVFASGFAIFLGIWVVSKVDVKFQTK